MSEVECKEEWKKIQERTFTKWFNNILSLGGHANDQVASLKNDLQDGLKLIQLLQTLTGENFKYNEQPKFKQQKFENLKTFFEYLEKANIKFVNIGKPKLL